MHSRQLTTRCEVYTRWAGFQQKGPWTLDDGCMADVQFELVASDTAKENGRR